MRKRSWVQARGARALSLRMLTAAVAGVLLGATFATPAVAGAARTAPQTKVPKRVQASVLFVVNAQRGTAASGTGTGVGATFPLEFAGVDPDALFFTDRPARDTGVIDVARMLKVLADGQKGPPNGVVEVTTGERGPVALAVELTAPKYDAATNILSYTAKVLKKTQGGRLHHYDNRLDVKLPATFARAALFIDSSPFGSTNFCTTNVQNSTEQTVNLTDQFKWGSDTWDPAPPSNGATLNLGQTVSWQSDGGFARGCGNSTTWQQQDGTTFHTSLTDPYGDNPNSISCTSSDAAGHPCHIDPNSTTRGASIDVTFYFCDLARQNPCPGI